MAFQSARLTAIFGASPQAVTYEQLEALIQNDAAGEAEDLDYKLRYDSGEKGSEDIAVDIATFANHLGGVLVVGMAEVNARPSKAVGIELIDEFKRRIRTCVASRIFPQPQFDIREVPDPADTSKKPRGLLLIMVPRSPLAPHAVMDPTEKEKLRWPRRHGTGKIWLTENEIASSYRRRFVAAVEQGERLDAVASDNFEATTRSADPPHPKAAGLLTISLVPDVPGDLILDGESFTRFRSELRAAPVFVGSIDRGEVGRVGVGPKRMFCLSSGPTFFRTELHTDGSGSFAVQLHGSIGQAGEARIWDTAVVMWTASALRFLARHARDRAGASGTAAVAVNLLSYSRVTNSSRALGGYAVIVTASHSSLGSEVHGPEHQRSAQGRADFLLDHLADDGQPLAQATASLVSELFHAYNAAETRQITRDGELRPAAWGVDRAQAEQWARNANIPIAGASASLAPTSAPRMLIPGRTHMGLSFSPGGAQWDSMGYKMFRTRLAAMDGIDLDKMDGFTTEPLPRDWEDYPTALEPLLNSSDVHGFISGEACQKMLPLLRVVAEQRGAEANPTENERFDLQALRSLITGMEHCAEHGCALSYG